MAIIGELRTLIQNRYINICLSGPQKVNVGYLVILNTIQYTSNFIKAGSFFLPETDFWCSPAELKLPRGQRPETKISPRSGEDNTTDHCLVYESVFSSSNITEISQVENTRECTRYKQKAINDQLI